MKLIPELDGTNHVLILRRVTKVGETEFARIKLTAQAQALVKRAMEAEPGYDADCWLRAVGTEFSDPCFSSPDFLEN